MKITLYVQYEDQIVDTEKEHKARIDENFQESLNEWSSDFDEYLSNHYGYQEIFDMDEETKKKVEEDFHQQFSSEYNYNNNWVKITKEI